VRRNPAYRTTASCAIALSRRAAEQPRPEPTAPRSGEALDMVPRPRHHAAQRRRNSQSIVPCAGSISITAPSGQVHRPQFPHTGADPGHRVFQGPLFRGGRRLRLGGERQDPLRDLAPESFIELTGGTFGYGRALVAGSPSIGGENVLYGLEAFHEDGLWDHGRRFPPDLRVQLLEVRGLNRSHPGKLQSSHEHGRNGWPPAAAWICCVRCRRGV